ncbi:hypothetical protein HN385_01455 [archaeon]|jgi:hypothetical protein|nr:hypothetical protein [archaeon]MBT3451322.1 hypothetical protein [archaeon]MBT6869362.1 hypothetical protein [archaeon]MBT7192525.1 hypothetical protein [archaeon]MBT7380601.1 hypothetical protein [archaeon]
MGLSTSGMDKAYKTSGEIFEQVSKLYKPGLAEQLGEIEPGEVVVVQGTYDHVEKLLDTIKVPYTSITSSEISTHNGGRVMFVNCASYNSVDGKTKNAIHNYVDEGGRLISTDWAVGLVEKVFPGKVQKTAKTGDDVVEIQCCSDLGRKFVGMNYAQCRPKWWLEGSSDIYSIGEGVTAIITSSEMEEKYGQPYVAVGFKEGKGEVIHFISHLELQRTHLRTEEDKEGLDTFLEKMKIEKTPEMDDMKVAELEAAYSTLNTVAYLCLRSPVLGGDMKSVTFNSTAGPVGGAVSKKLV